ncbi:STAS domain-containing protein [Alteromonas gilva]|uniref:STAS domain-containing protein n=1 Tax=Alteromonas gilva TaxID=2987522 RepID=A0ABT5L3V9_9ALTE|nr:STAS domain-containing protein [Alteromonas gilva]MDC8831538.1 STAS domain-containing protein [Alteromonas gilva]
MTINTEVTNKTLVIQVGDKFDFSLVDKFRLAYEDMPAEISQIDVDLAATQYMDSSALGMLLNMQKVLAGRKLTYRIINSQPQIGRILEISRFNKKFVIE